MRPAGLAAAYFTPGLIWSFSNAFGAFGRTSLGLKRIGDVVVKEDRPEIRGMVRAVTHLVAVEEVD